MNNKDMMNMDITSISKKYSYNLGDKARPGDIVILDSVKESFAFASQLQRGDAAFILRSDSTWCFAIVAQKVEGVDPHIHFIVGNDGSIKYFSMKRWTSFICGIKAPPSHEIKISRRSNVKVEKRKEYHDVKKECRVPATIELSPHKSRSKSISKSKGSSKPWANSRKVHDCKQARNELEQVIDGAGIIGEDCEYALRKESIESSKTQRAHSRSETIITGSTERRNVASAKSERRRRPSAKPRKSDGDIWKENQEGIGAARRHSSFVSDKIDIALLLEDEKEPRRTNSENVDEFHLAISRTKEMHQAAEESKPARNMNRKHQRKDERKQPTSGKAVIDRKIGRRRTEIDENGRKSRSKAHAKGETRRHSSFVSDHAIDLALLMEDDASTHSGVGRTLSEGSKFAETKNESETPNLRSKTATSRRKSLHRKMERSRSYLDENDKKSGDDHISGTARRHSSFISDHGIDLDLLDFDDDEESTLSGSDNDTEIQFLIESIQEMIPDSEVKDQPECKKEEEKPRIGRSKSKSRSKSLSRRSKSRPRSNVVEERKSCGDKPTQVERGIITSEAAKLVSDIEKLFPAPAPEELFDDIPSEKVPSANTNRFAPPPPPLPPPPLRTAPLPPPPPPPPKSPRSPSGIGNNGNGFSKDHKRQSSFHVFAKDTQEASILDHKRHSSFHVSPPPLSSSKEEDSPNGIKNLFEEFMARAA